MSAVTQIVSFERRHRTAIHGLTVERERVQTEKNNIDLEIAKIRAQLQNPLPTAGGEWRQRASYALKMKGNRSQELQQQLGALRRQITQERAKRDERLFVDAARTILDQATYLRIWDATEHLRND